MKQLWQSGSWSRIVVIAALAVAPVLAGAERMTCVPVPVDPECVPAGENVFPWDPEGPTCCEGLAATAWAEFDPMTGLCLSMDGALVCLACGDGVCDEGENICNCPGDCTEVCVPRGEFVFPWDRNGSECCDGLTATVIAELDPTTGGCIQMDGALVCLACGDGVCDQDEDICNCPADCTEECATAGEYVHPWDPNGPECCPGLRASGVYEIDAAGVCQPLLGGAICIACGDRVCGPGEDSCNCPDDCAADCEGLPEDACVDRNGCLPGYAGFCDCTCPGPPGYEGGGCEGCSADCFMYAACVAGPEELDIDLETDGGFDGSGGMDISVHDGFMAVHNPFGHPENCTVELRETQMARLLTAAGHVDWTGLARSYISPDNPYCCCDQFVYGLDALIHFGGGAYVSTATEWCDESYYMGSMPAGFLAFYDELSLVAREVSDFCRPMP